MKLVMFNVRYVASLDKVNAVLDEHRAYLKDHYAKGVLYVSGPVYDSPEGDKVGGFVLGKMTEQEAKSFVEHDPFYKEGVAEYSIRFLDPVLSSDAFRGMIKG